MEKIVCYQLINNLSNKCSNHKLKFESIIKKLSVKNNS